MKTACDRGRMNRYIIFLILLLLFAENSLAYSSFVSVSISSIPTGANIYINSEYKGRTPITINLPEGSYSIKMNITGYKSIISDFNIVPDMVSQEINATFEPISPNTVDPISIETTPLQSVITVKDIGIDKELNKHIVLVNINSKIGQLIYMEEYYSINGAGNLKLDSRIIYYNNTIKNSELTLKIKRPLDKMENTGT